MTLLYFKYVLFSSIELFVVDINPINVHILVITYRLLFKC